MDITSKQTNGPNNTKLFLLINLEEIMWHAEKGWPLTSQKGLQDYNSTSHLWLHITDDKWGHLLRPQLLNIQPCFHIRQLDGFLRTIERQQSIFRITYTEATWVSSSSCSQTRRKTNPRPLNVWSRTHTGAGVNRGWKAAFNRGGTWLQLKVMILIKYHTPQLSGEVTVKPGHLAANLIT